MESNTFKLNTVEEVKAFSAGLDAFGNKAVNIHFPTFWNWMIPIFQDMDKLILGIKSKEEYEAIIKASQSN